jgi:hypothetical protein
MIIAACGWGGTEPGIEPRIDPNAEVLGALRVLTRRIGLEPVVLQYPALPRAPAPSEQGTT